MSTHVKVNGRIYSSSTWEEANAVIGYRRTGITLREGKRDEHGMEEIDGMFSSPEKSPVKENGFNHHGNETTIGSDGMSMDEGMYQSPPPPAPCLL